MATSEAQKRASAKYRKNNVKAIMFNLYPSDKDLLEFLESKKNRSSYIVPNFIDCIVFGQRAEALSRFISKGAKVSIDGKLHYSSWETKDGQRRSKLEVVVEEIEFLSKSQTTAVTAQGQPSFTAPQAPEEELYDSDIPF